MAQTRNSPEDVLVTVPASIHTDDVLAALADAERRQLLVHLTHLETPERLSALTRWLATEAGLGGGESVQQLFVRMHHVHVPKLAEIGLVSNDVEEGMVSLTEAGQTVAEGLDR